jgi:magnesium-transporting ATPase (P-type)
LHRISYLKIAFYLLGMFFQVQAMFFSREMIFLKNLNSMLLMYGIAMSFESLRDNDALSEGERRSYLTKSKLWAWFLALLFAGGLFAMAVGCLQFFLTRDYELGWGITTFGLGMIALGRQQYDQFTAVLSKAELAIPPDGDSPGSLPLLGA